MIEKALLSILLGALLRGGVRIGLTFLLVLFLVLGFTIASLTALLATVVPAMPVAEADADTIPADQLAAMKHAATTAGCTLPWQVLAAIARLDSNFGQAMAADTAGTGGYIRFQPADWERYGDGGNPFAYQDALPALARHLCAQGGVRRLRDVLFASRHGEDYVNNIFALAAKYGYLPDGSRRQQAIALALAQEGKPYVWGGASPETSFDCSGLVQWVYGQVGIRLPRTAQQQYDATERVSRDDLQAGDLVFFAQTYPSSEFVTHVGIYLGDGMMINAPVEGKPISRMPVFSGFWGEHYAGGGRMRGG